VASKVFDLSGSHDAQVLAYCIVTSLLCRVVGELKSALIASRNKDVGSQKYGVGLVPVLELLLLRMGVN